MKKLLALMLALLTLAGALPALAEEAAAVPEESSEVIGMIVDASMHMLSVTAEDGSLYEFAMDDDTVSVTTDGLGLGLFVMVEYVHNHEENEEINYYDTAVRITELATAAGTIAAVDEKADTITIDEGGLTKTLDIHQSLLETAVVGDEVCLLYESDDNQNFVREILTQKTIEGELLSTADSVMNVKIDSERTYAFPLDGAKLPRIEVGSKVRIAYYGALIDETGETDQFVRVASVEPVAAAAPAAKAAAPKASTLSGVVKEYKKNGHISVTSHGHTYRLNLSRHTKIVTKASTVNPLDDVKITYTGTLNKSQKQQDVTVSEVNVTKTVHKKENESHKLEGTIKDGTNATLTIRTKGGKTYAFLMDDDTKLRGKTKKGLAIGEKVVVHYHGILQTGKKNQDILLTRIDIK